MTSTLDSAVRPTALAFPDRKEDGRFPVTTDDGRVVAHLTATWTGIRFTATDASGAPLCAGSAKLGGLSRTWTATGRTGQPLLTVRRSWSGARAEVVLERGGAFALRGSLWGRDFRVTAPDGATVVEAVPATSAWSLRPYDYAVRQAEPAFDLAELVALVQIWRMAQKADAAAAVGGAAVAVTGVAGA